MHEQTIWLPPRATAFTEICEACEEEIAPARLRAHPFAVRCTRCQEIWERDQSRSEAGSVRGRALPEETA